MKYRPAQMNGTPSSQSIFTRYQQIGYLKGILNYASTSSIKEAVEEEVEKAISNLNPSDISGMDEYVSEAAEKEVKSYIDSDEFRDKTAKVDTKKETLYIFPDDEEIDVVNG